jgi:hypothetical protein
VFVPAEFQASPPTGGVTGLTKLLASGLLAVLPSAEREDRRGVFLRTGRERTMHGILASCRMGTCRVGEGAKRVGVETPVGKG